MIKITSSLVFPMICIIMFSLVEQNMSCLTILDERGVTCGATCKDRFGPATRSLFEPDGGIWRCVCIYPCPLYMSPNSALL
ncbi:hypothetical protein F2Q69_00057686 [Brassica cretica]|uniref:Defensin-like protein n=1 Tax=Brassica cretica TaxID=69181 RepID=A0A8S9N8G6_BRACR|nr:hypothetical protein F2Q69_00057686 [Brassica cretica]